MHGESDGGEAIDVGGNASEEDAEAATSPNRCPSGDGENNVETGSDTEEEQERVLCRVWEYLFALENAACRAGLPVREMDTDSAVGVMNNETFLYLHETEVCICRTRCTTGGITPGANIRTLSYYDISIKRSLYSGSKGW